MYKFSGHESFPFRYPWLPKAYFALKSNTSLFVNEENAMLELGVGKNMVRAIRFWIQAIGIATSSGKGNFDIKDFGRVLLSEEGYDPYLEDIKTLWLIHWKLVTKIDEPLFAWDYMLNRWQYPEIIRSNVIESFYREANKLERNLSPVTLGQHFDIFLHSYVPTHNNKSDLFEDNLDCPLVELNLIQSIGERRNISTGNHELIYRFRREDKPEISNELFIYCLNEFWNTHFTNEQTLSFRDICIGHGSPGQVFKIPEANIKERLVNIENVSQGAFSYMETNSLQQVIKREVPERDFLAEIYLRENACA
ncbi:MAG: DUF4007 family protein [Nitrospirae bacterium]|nr:DUF4007 family protein [Nitrospirota bacterium]